VEVLVCEGAAVPDFEMVLEGVEVFVLLGDGVSLLETDTVGADVLVLDGMACATST